AEVRRSRCMARRRLADFFPNACGEREIALHDIGPLAEVAKDRLDFTASAGVYFYLGRPPEEEIVDEDGPERGDGRLSVFETIDLKRRVPGVRCAASSVILKGVNARRIRSSGRSPDPDHLGAVSINDVKL